MKKELLIAGGVILAIILTMFIFLTNGLSEGARVQINGLDLSVVADGVYVGEYEFKRWSESVIVNVRNGEIVEIRTEKDRIYDVSEEVIARVITAQNTTIDAVSGATVSSKALLKAIENAFR